MDNNEQISTLLHGGTGTGTGDEEDDPRRSALHNPLILGEIFSHLDTKNVKEVRRVCKSWEPEGTILLGKRSHLPLYSIFNHYNKMTEELMAVNPKLLQSITIYPSIIDATVCFNSFAPIWHHAVEEITVNGMDVDFCVGFPETLNAHGFPHLTKITINRMADSDSNVPLRPINTLKELQITGDNCSYHLIQNLINSAPNLEVLENEGMFYPNLASCAKLKALKWFGSLNVFTNTNGEGSRKTWRTMEKDEVFRIINGVGDHLEHLSLEAFISDSSPCSRDKKFNQRFQKFPKLNSLNLDRIDVFNILEQICPLLFPSLEIVSMQYGSFQFLCPTRVNQGSYLTHEGVSSLELMDVDRIQIISMASKRFPNVNRLVIRIVEPVTEERYKKGLYLYGEEEDYEKELADEVVGIIGAQHFLSTVLQTCSTWKLLYLELQIRTTFKLSQFFEELKSLSLLEGIKEMRIVVPQGLCNYLFDDDLGEDFQELTEVLLLSSKMDRMIFDGFALNPTTTKKILEFRNQHKDLPLFFLD